MHIKTFSSRVYALERSFRRRYPTIDPVRILESVVERLSDEDLHLLCQVRRGTISSDELTDQDCDALQSFIDAVEGECQRLGFSSWDALQGWVGE